MTEANSSLFPRIIQLEEGWNTQIKARAIDVLEDVLDNGISPGKESLFAPNEYVNIYTVCYDMCTQRSPYNYSRELYNRHGETIERYLTTKVLPALREKVGQGGTLLLSELKHRWANHQIMNKWLKKFFSYLDRYFVVHHTLPSLLDAGLRHFKTQVYEEVKTDATNAVISLIDEEREGIIIDRGLVRSIVELYESMGMGNLDAYVHDLEEPLLESTKTYFVAKRQKWIVEDSTPDYLIKAERVLHEERLRVAEYLNPATESRLLRVCEEQILEKVETQLLEKEGSGCQVLLANDRAEDLKRMFRLYERLENGLNPIAKIFRLYIVERGNHIINTRRERVQSEKKEKNDDPDFVRGLLELHDKYLGVVEEVYSSHPLFQKAMKEAFQDIVNTDVGNFTNAELLSTFCDRILKSGTEKLTEQEVERNLKRIVQLFSYLNDKDLFAEIYRNQLATRLLNQRSATNDLEKNMIAKLKIQCGTHYTSRMEGMLRDLAVGGDQLAKFKRHAEQKQQDSKTSLEFSVQVLTTGFWPTYMKPEPNLPDELQHHMDTFADWHDKEHARRKLTWIFSLGSANVRATLTNPRRQYDLSVSTLQAIVLNAFNDSAEFTADQLGAKLNLEFEILRALLGSLACTKYKLLVKDTPGPKIVGTTKFKANVKFSSKIRRIQTPKPNLQTSHNKNRVEEDRSHAIDSAIVRIMKARKTLGHTDLIGEVMSQLVLFQPNSKQVRRRIESLIDREFLARSEHDRNTYEYLA